jgi:hypothetical protein
MRAEFNWPTPPGATSSATRFHPENFGTSLDPIALVATRTPAGGVRGNPDAARAVPASCQRLLACQFHTTLNECRRS